MLVPGVQQPRERSTHLCDIRDHAVVLLLLQPCPQLVQPALQLGRLARLLGALREGEAAAAAQLQGARQTAVGSESGLHE